MVFFPVCEVGKEDDGGQGLSAGELYRLHIMPVQTPADNLPVLPVAVPGTGRNLRGWGWVGKTA